MTVQNLDAFRMQTRSWLEANCPSSMRTPMPDDEIVWGGRRASFKNPDSKLWLERMVARGWTVPSWPKTYGGGGLLPDEARILEEEMRRLDCRPPLQSSSRLPAVRAATISRSATWPSRTKRFSPSRRRCSARSS